ncbi:MAG: transcription initiation factor IIB [Flavobacteriales bacterium]|nr:transcription initiation factor IIB [Flavobacteriales bacterium]|tara:strand:- start:3065 stop:3985 length:921 start_codon:yes stop_codon:yes gene_type:complete
MSEDAIEIVRCKECGSRNLEKDITRGELNCVDCGLVLEENLVDPGAEWRSFDDGSKDDPSRTGAPMNIMLHDKGLSTDIDWQNRDWSGKSLKSNSQMYRMRKWQKRARVSDSRERNLANALAELDKMAMHLDGLPRTVRQEAANVYKKTLEAGLIRGRSIQGAAAASLYIACQLCGVPRTLDEVAQKLKLGRKEIGRTVRTIKRELKMKPMTTKPEQYIDRFCSDLQLRSEVVAQCHKWMEEIKRLELDSGRGPVGIAASLIYMASIIKGQNRTQREIADVTNVTEVTIRNRYKELAAALDVELNI